MSELKLPRLLAAAKEFNIGQDTLIDFLLEKGFPKDDLKPTSKLTEQMYEALKSNYLSDKHAKINRDQIELPKGSTAEAQKEAQEKEDLKPEENVPEKERPKVVKRIDLSAIDSSTRPKKGAKYKISKVAEDELKQNNEFLKDTNEELQKPENISPLIEEIEVEKLTGPKILGKIDFPETRDTRPVSDEKRKRKRFPIERPVKNKNKLLQMSWQEMKEKYKLGYEFEFILKAKAQPGVLIFAISESFNGILHISDLNWNFGLCQLDYRNARIGAKMKVQIIGYDKRFGKVLLSRKNIKEIQKPSESLEWEKLELNKEIKVTVFEELKRKIVIQTETGLFGTIPIIEGKHFAIGSKVAVIPTRKVSHQNLLECIQKELTELNKDQIKSAVESFKELAPENGFLTSEKHLSSIENLKSSFYWNYFDDNEKQTLESLFGGNPNLFSKVDKSNVSICFEFDFNSSVYDDFKFKIAHHVFDLNGLETPDNELLQLLGDMNFWYTQYETSRNALGTNQLIVEKYFNLFNEKVSIKGVVTEEGGLRIKNIKSKVNEGALRENQVAMKRYGVIYLNRPLAFSKYSCSCAENKIFIQLIDDKILALKLFEHAKTKSLSILQQQGKNFKIFHNYLESQIEYENKENEKKEFGINNCQLEPGIHLGGLLIKADAISKPNIEIGDRATISIRDNRGKLKSVGACLLQNKTDNTLSFKSNIENIDLLREGAVLKKIISTRQHDVQIEALNKFFSNKLPLDTLYQVFHNKELIESPDEPEIDFFNKKLAEKEGPQSRAVKKAIGNKNILLIQGPPGTGKTTVITEIVKQLISRGKKVLVTSQTHIAVDNVLERVCEDSNIHIARIGSLESISDTASKYLLDEGRKLFAQKLKKNVDTKIDLVNLHINGSDISIYNTEPINEVKIFDWDNMEQFIDHIKASSEEQNKKTISYLEHWKDVIVKSPILLTDIFLKNLDVVFGTCIGIATNKEFSESDVYFDTVILDEAGKANISETLTAISRAKRIILVGDHKQLPPFLDRERVSFFQQFSKETEEQKPSEEDVKKALGASFFEYLQKEGVLPLGNKIQLDVQYRMHPDIANFISWTFYNSSLKNGENTLNNVIPLPEPFDKQIIFIDTSSDMHSSESFSNGSYFNQVEAEFIVKRIIPELDKNNVSPESYAVLSPYSGQCEKITELLNEVNNESRNMIEIATLDSFQGREYDVIVFSFTRSSLDKKVGFLDDARRLNVALSRAKKKLILIGNAKTLKSTASHFDKYYSNLFRNLWEYAGKYGYAFTPNDLDFRKLQMTFNVGEIKKGKIKRINNGGISVNMGLKEGIIPKSFFKVNYHGLLREGQEVEVEILWVSSGGKITLAFSNKTDIVYAKKILQYLCFKTHFSVGQIIDGTLLRIEPGRNGIRRLIIELPCNTIGISYSLNMKNKFVVSNKIAFRVTGCQDEKIIIKGEIVL